MVNLRLEVCNEMTERANFVDLGLDVQASCDRRARRV
jgi:hypothetical protein